MLSNLFGKRKKIKRDDDKVWRDQSHKISGVCDDAVALKPNAARALVVAHFRQTFHFLEDAFRARALDYVTYPTAFEGARLRSPAEYAQPGKVLLSLADALPVSPYDTAVDPAPCDFEIVVLVAEHHPLRSGDESLETFAEQLPCPSRLVFYEALDGALLSRFSGDVVGRLWTALKLADDQALSQPTITKAIRSAQEKIGQRVSVDIGAGSAELWFQQNLPD